MKSRQFKYIILASMIATSSIVSLTYAQSMDDVTVNNINSAEYEYKNINFPLLANKVTLKVGESLDHEALAYIIDANKLVLPEGYRYQANIIEGSEYFEGTTVNKEKGKGVFRIQIIDTDGKVVAQSKQCIKFIICEDIGEVVETIVPHTPYIQGYEDGSFRADQGVTREEFATMVSRLMLKGTMPNYEEMYEDLDEYRYSTEHIEYLASQGIVTGYEDGMFMPKASITRAEAAHVIDRVIGYLSRRQVVRYTDVEETHWAYESIMRVTSMGYMEGSDLGNGKIGFRPNDVLTRAEAVILLNKVFDRDCSDVEISHSYTDLTPSHWAYKEILDASIYHEHIIVKKS